MSGVGGSGSGGSGGSGGGIPHQRKAKKLFASWAQPQRICPEIFTPPRRAKKNNSNQKSPPCWGAPWVVALPLCVYEFPETLLNIVSLAFDENHQVPHSFGVKPTCHEHPDGFFDTVELDCSGHLVPP